MATYNQVSYGSSDKNTVTELQKLLNQNGANLTVDGIFGDQTKQAVMNYQKANNLTVDGIVGNNTWGALTKAQESSSSSPSSATTEPEAPAQTETKSPTFEYGDYKPSDTVAQAEAMLQQHLANKPGAYQSAWQTQLDDTLNKILNREKFTYDLNGDALYQQYKDQYMLQGQQAMMDTMGQAAAMTGGYGNSYAQTAGQQTYQGYLQQLNDRVPELYQLALDQYNQEGQDLYNQYGLYADREDQDYSRYRDQKSDYYTDLDRLTEDARYQGEMDYNKWVDGRDFAYGQYADDRAYAYQAERDKEADRQWQAQFDEAKRQYDQQYALSTSGSSSGSSTGSNYSGGNDTGTTYTANPGWDTAKIKAFQQAHELTVDGIWGPQTAAAYDKDPNWTGGGSDDDEPKKVDLGTREGQLAMRSQVNTEITNMLRQGLITAEEAAELRRQNRQVY